ncbi:flippase [Peribacillus frigoritolerans]|uniref:flippase n=1 Tax=Peribacillus frigoritolerans TaxID=450367 RepID=UPI00105A61FC|nr:flippase [Peribacillus frigoritolerans]TDL78990.1 flippase [Peribacillus frigoritolerans]
MSIKKNYLYNLTYQVLIMILPLITVPYVSRVLKPEGVGTFAYTSSIVQYFIIFGMLGIGTYGNKMIAMTRDNKEEMSKTFFQIYLLQLLLTITSVIGYVIFILFIFHEYKIIALLQAVALIAAVIDCSWLFNGLEQFKKIVTRNIVVKLLSLLAIFMFVKSQEDLATYTIIMGLSSFLGQLIMWLYVSEHIKRVPINASSVFKHIKPTIVYFLPQVAMQIYFVLNKTMLGIFSSNIEVGIYDYADKILKMALAVVTSLGMVMLPRMANTFVKGDLVKARDYLSKSLDFSTLIAIPIMFGLAGIAKEFIPWYMGKEFSGSAVVLEILSPTIFLMAWSGVFGTQYLVPLGKMREYTTSLYIGAIINLIINFILIREYGAVGAAIGTLCAEITVIVVQILFVRKDIDIRRVTPKLIIYLISGGLMFGVVRFIGGLLGSTIITTFVQVLVGIIIYFGIVILFELFYKDGLILNAFRKMGK